VGSPFVRTLCVGLLSALVAWAATLTSPVRSFENFLSDVRTSAHNDAELLSGRVIIIAIDDASLNGFPYTTPINRHFLADVVTALDKSGIDAIGLDVLLDRPTEPAADAALARAMADARAPVLLVSDPGPQARLALCGGARLDAEPPSTLLAPFRSAARPAHGVLCMDRLDDVHRRVAQPQQILPSLAEGLYLAGGGEAPLPARPWTVPYGLTEDGRWPFPTFSAAMTARLPEGALSGKIALVGVIAPYSGDWKTTPLRFAPLLHIIGPQDRMPEGKIPGVVLHAYALEALLDGSARRARASWTGPLLILLGVASGMALGLSRLALWRVAAALLAVIVIGWLAVFQGHALFGVMVPFTGFAAGLIVAATACFALLERRERAQRRMIHASFAHFLAPEVVNLLARSPERLTLEAEDIEVTALFTDLAGFTRFVDTTPPAQVSAALNGYLDVIVEAVVAHGGVVDKIVGDAVHALFSAPLRDPAHRENAVNCALDIEARTEAFRARSADTGVPLGETRIGVNSGRALVGNFGSSKRFDYTAHGSTINIAARLEAANKDFGTRICISEHSRVDLPGIAYREIGRIELRGVADPLTVYEARPSGSIDAADLAAYGAALALAATDPDAAARAFADLAARAPGDRLVAYQLGRLRAG